MRTAFVGPSLLSILLLACGDDGGSAEASSSGSTTDGGSTSSMSSTGEPGSSTTDPGSTTELGSTSGGSSSSGGADGSGSSSGGESSSSGGQAGPISLQNDMWRDGTSTAVQGGFVMGECWASTYVPEPEHYPFRLDGFQVVISGDVEDVTEPFEVGVWTVDANNMPQSQIASVVAEFTATADAFNGVTFSVLEVDDIVIDAGNFAISMCLTEHDGYPAIATDVGGDLIEDRNWLYTGGAWGQSGGFGLTGNWIMRAIIEPQ